MLILKTERTIISNISTSDAPFIKELVNTPGWLKFIGDRNIHTIIDAKNYIINTYLASFEKFGYSYYLVSLHNNTPIGICGFLKKDYLDFPDFGFAFLPDYHQQGYGFESGTAILDFGIKQLELDDIVAITMLNNNPSMKLLSKIGFEQKGIITLPNTNEELNLFRLV